MTKLLASVAGAAEAEAALEGGAGVIDLKDPTHGALAALDPAVVRQVVARVRDRRPVSATIGDLPMVPDALASAARRMAATGVDYLKIGIRPAGALPACLAAVARAAPATRLIAVFFADAGPAPLPLETLVEHRFAGVMWDTAGKRSGGLRDHLDGAFLSRFIGAAKAHRLLVGLAGSLRAADIAPLRALRPDYLGFRTALCEGEDRAGRLDAAAVARLAAMLGPRRASAVGA